MKNELPTEQVELVDTARQPQSHPANDETPARFRSSNISTPEIDAELVNKTKNQIRNLVAEISDLSKTCVDSQRFFEGFLNRTVSALASDGGAIWLDKSGSQTLELYYQVNLEKTQLATDSNAQVRHGLLLKNIRQQGEPALVPPHSGSANLDHAANPTSHLLIVGQLVVNGKSVGLVEIFQRAGAGPTTQRGYLRFLSQVCEIAADYLKCQEIRNFAEQQLVWQQVDDFVRQVYAGLNPDQTTYVIANEGRRIIGCDRVSAARLIGGRYRIKAVSGLDTIERRADQVKLLEKLTAAVVRTRGPMWYGGDDASLPPQIESRLHAYLDKSHAKLVGIIPLFKQSVAAEKTAAQKPSVIGALIVEQLKDTILESAMQKRVELICQHGQSALTNSLEHHSLFLLPVWKTLGQFAQPFRSTQLPKTILCLAVLASITAFFALFPYPFTLRANGQLQPLVQREIYAQVSGILQELFVAENDSVRVSKDEILARLSNNDLDVQIQNLEGQISQTNEQIRKYSRAQSDRHGLDKLDSVMLDGESLKATQQLESLKRELQIKKQQAENLIVRSPADGIVVNWQVRQALLKRPVERGQNLMTVVDPTGGWQLEIEIPERRLGHLLQRVHSKEEPVQVSFALVSHPGQEYSGTLVQVDEKLDVYSDDGNCAKAIIRFENGQVPAELLKAGTRINAKLNCGTRSIGFVWFHEFFETIETACRYWL